jgi:lambda repressor-like predicted transcriptional regulator
VRLQAPLPPPLGAHISPFAVTCATDIPVDLSNMPRKARSLANAATAIGLGRASMEAAMSNSYWRTERLIVDAVDRRILQKPGVWDGVVSIFTDPDIMVLAAFCIVGLLFSLAATLIVPGFSETIQALQQFL